MKRDYPILEFDADADAVIEPRHGIPRVDHFPEHCVLSFLHDVVDHFREEGLLKQITALRSEMGKHPVYALEAEGQTVALFHPGVGAPLHAHAHESIVYVVKGKVPSKVGSEEYVLGPGDVCRHPKGVLHGLEAVEESVVVEIKAPAPEIASFFAMGA